MLTITWLRQYPYFFVFVFKVIFSLFLLFNKFVLAFVIQFLTIAIHFCIILIQFLTIVIELVHTMLYNFNFKQRGSSVSHFLIQN